MRAFGGGGGGQPGFVPSTPMVINMPLIIVANDLVKIPFAVAADMVSTGAPITGSLQAIAAGSLAVDLKNDAGTIFATLTWTAAGAPTISNRNVSTIVAGDTLHVNATAIGTTPLGLAITLWWRTRG